MLKCCDGGGSNESSIFALPTADLNLVGFIPEEIKWLTSLESFDIQNNHLVRGYL